VKRQSSPTPRSNGTRSSKYVCVKHRTVDKPCCDTEKVVVSYRWRAPKKRDERAWRRIEQGNWLWENKVSWRDADADRSAWWSWRARRANSKHGRRAGDPR
jgi:hypothetical protein